MSRTFNKNDLYHLDGWHLPLDLVEFFDSRSHDGWLVNGDLSPAAMAVVKEAAVDFYRTMPQKNGAKQAAIEIEVGLSEIYTWAATNEQNAILNFLRGVIVGKTDGDTVDGAPPQYLAFAAVDAVRYLNDRKAPIRHVDLFGESGVQVRLDHNRMG